MSGFIRPASNGGRGSRPPICPGPVDVFQYDSYQRNTRIDELEVELHRRDLAIARLEIHLEHAKIETQAVLRTITLLSGLPHGHTYQNTAETIIAERAPEPSTKEQHLLINHTSSHSPTTGLAVEKKFDMKGANESYLVKRDGVHYMET
jgi:hypothetical protein